MKQCINNHNNRRDLIFFRERKMKKKKRDYFNSSLFNQMTKKREIYSNIMN